MCRVRVLTLLRLNPKLLPPPADGNPAICRHRCRHVLHFHLVSNLNSLPAEYSRTDGTVQKTMLFQTLSFWTLRGLLSPSALQSLGTLVLHVWSRFWSAPTLSGKLFSCFYCAFHRFLCPFFWYVCTLHALV
eukprot:RCo029530